MDGLPDVFRPRRRRAAAPRRRRPRHHLPLRPLCDRRRRDPVRPPERPRMGGLRHPRPRPRPTLPTTRASRAMPAAPATATCSSRSSPACSGGAVHRGGAAAARRRRHRHRAGQRHGGAVGASAARRPRSLATRSARPAGPLPGLLPVSGEGWEPRFDPVPALGEHTEAILAELGRGQTRQDEGGSDVMIPKPDRHQDMREALRDLCAEFPAGVSPRPRREGHLSGRVHRCADRGRLARGDDPGGIWRLRPRPDRGVGGDGGDQPLRRQCRPLPRPDVQHGDAAPARLGGAEAALPAEDRQRRTAPPVDGGDRADHRHRHDQAQDDGGADKATATSSTARRCGSRASSTPT